MNLLFKGIAAVSIVLMFSGCGEEKQPPAATTNPTAGATTTQSTAAEPYPGFNDLKAKADKGDVSAMYALGTKAPTLEDAFFWFKKGAENGDAPSQFFLGRMYLNGVTVPANKETAIEWYKKAAAQGNQNAKDALAKLEKGSKAK